jgi:hypothetical protein
MNKEELKTSHLASFSIFISFLLKKTLLKTWIGFHLQKKFFNTSSRCFRLCPISQFMDLCERKIFGEGFGM